MQIVCMRNYIKIIFALVIIAGLILMARWGQKSSTPQTENTAPTPKSTTPVASVAAPKVPPAPVGDKSEPPAKTMNPVAMSPPAKPAFGAKYEADFGDVELEDGVAVHLTMNTGGTCEIRPTVLPDGNFKLVLVLAFIDTDTGETQIATPSITTPPGQPVWFGLGGKEEDENGPKRFGVSFTPKLKSK